MCWVQLHLQLYHHSRPFKAERLFMYSVQNFVRFWWGNCTQHIRLILNCQKTVLCLTQTQTAMIQPTCLTRSSIMLRSMICCFESKILNLRGSSIIGTDAVPLQPTMWSKLSSVFSVISLSAEFVSTKASSYRFSSTPWSCSTKSVAFQTPSDHLCVIGSGTSYVVKRTRCLVGAAIWQEEMPFGCEMQSRVPLYLSR